MVPLDHCDCAPGADELLQDCDRLCWPGEVLEDKAEEQVIEGLGLKGKIEYIRLEKIDILKACLPGPSPGLEEEGAGYVQ